MQKHKCSIDIFLAVQINQIRTEIQFNQFGIWDFGFGIWVILNLDFRFKISENLFTTKFYLNESIFIEIKKSKPEEIYLPAYNLLIV